MGGGGNVNEGLKAFLAPALQSYNFHSPHVHDKKHQLSFMSVVPAKISNSEAKLTVMTEFYCLPILSVKMPGMN